MPAIPEKNIYINDSAILGYSGISTIQNIFVKNNLQSVYWNGVPSYTVYMKNPTVTGDLGQIQVVLNNGNMNDFIVGELKLNHDLIDFSRMQPLTADIASEFVRDTTQYFNTGSRNYYKISFVSDRIVDDNLKKFGGNHLYVVHRTDAEAVLIPAGAPKKINNYQLLNNDGSTVFQYENDEKLPDSCRRVGCEGRCLSGTTTACIPLCFRMSGITKHTQ